MKVIKLQDRMKTSIKYRLDLSPNEMGYIECLIENGLEDKDNQGYTDKLSNDTEFTEYMVKSKTERIECYQNMLESIENQEVVRVDCYNSDIGQENFEEILEKYKK